MARVSRVLLIVSVALAAAGPAAPAGAVAGIPGIDVSMWQGKIAWQDVAAAGVEFAVIRATKGDDFVDPRFERNLTRGTASGVVIGAYHRATPSAKNGDALAEANYYLHTARNGPGDVIPALDIEETGGLSVPALRSWVRTWVTRVRDRIGVRPMIYTSPNFWRTNLGDTTWFAERGYPLWIANWDVPQPQEIAEDWDGNGWTYWQWTVDDPGSVPGIETAIDRDVFVGADLLDGTIASLVVTPAAGGSITGPRIACGGEGGRCSRRANPNEEITLTAIADEGHAFHGWTGACAAAGTAPTCDVTLRGAVAVSALFEPAVVLPEDAEGSAFGWGTRAERRALGDSYRVERTKGASLTWEVQGGRVVLHTVEGRAMGKARVRVDGTQVLVLDGWARATAIRRTVLAGLGHGQHELTVTALGAGRPRSSGTEVGVDAIRWGGELRDDPVVSSGRWGPIERAPASDGVAVRSGTAGATARLAFTGTGITWITAFGPNLGRALVRIDGEAAGVIDLYSPATTYGVEETFLGLDDGEHVIKVVVKGSRNAASTGTAVVVDGWIVR